MRISKKTRESVRVRADFACEFCDISETDAGGPLTVDHYQPRSRGGTNDPDNLLYCCFSCNMYKQNYFSANTSEIPLWNPRTEPSSIHFIELDSGYLHPLTPVGIFTLQRLRLNRPFLVAHRLQKHQSEIYLQLLKRYNDLTDMLERLNLLLHNRLEEQRRLLKEQEELIHLLLKLSGKHRKT